MNIRIEYKLFLSVLPEKKSPNSVIPYRNLSPQIQLAKPNSAPGLDCTNGSYNILLLYFCVQRPINILQIPKKMLVSFII